MYRHLLARIKKERPEGLPGVGVLFVLLGEPFEALFFFALRLFIGTTHRIKWYLCGFECQIIVMSRQEGIFPPVCHPFILLEVR
jgi:hypothetical protein